VARNTPYDINTKASTRDRGGGSRQGDGLGEAESAFKGVLRDDGMPFMVAQGVSGQAPLFCLCSHRRLRSVTISPGTETGDKRKSLCSLLSKSKREIRM
jgi:hypothetical protein